MNKKLEKIVDWNEQSGWILEAKRRKRWRLVNKLFFKIEVKYLRLKRKIKNFNMI